MSANKFWFIVRVVVLVAAAIMLVKPPSALADVGPAPRTEQVNVVLQNVSHRIERINPRCAPGTHPFRIWRLYPGPNGEILKPGVLKLVGTNGLATTKVGPPNISPVNGKRYWEFYDFHARIAPLSEQFRQAEVHNATVTEGSNPMLKLVFADCIGE